ncbi:hypothetical protein PUNSTDRAFT_128947 [Punctularia strigosozonata HHB-11173 SS5]|uniref:uncharacterized protein n=1 Tax=Punctularia strigosozonata (strain HHB-11173) TaxID=741275 RepID=UPI0004417296|nr:uncharacterized protein PUNSTDRAFT_128947 [Punctularia strigosozonata HHB-11173 SS5]EIN13260.1 hypothetical protein PUNSTDRAFT_128947 [Punctularia strigosozonata HHB-11173 SS5]
MSGVKAYNGDGPEATLANHVASLQAKEPLKEGDGGTFGRRPPKEDVDDGMDGGDVTGDGSEATLVNHITSLQAKKNL